MTPPTVAAVASGAKPRTLELRDARDRAERALTPRELAVFQEMVGYYEDQRLGNSRVKRETLRREISFLWDFVAFSQAPPWRVDEPVVAKWGRHLFDDYGHSKGHQKTAKRALRFFLELVAGTAKYATTIPMEFGGCRVVQLVHRWNSQVYGRGIPRKIQPCLDREEIDALLDGIYRAIEIARVERSKDLHPLERDFAIVYAAYALGLRAMEIEGLNFDGWRWNEVRPEFGKLGYTIVRGKFDKDRPVFTTTPKLVDVLSWYLAEVRPFFLKHSAPGERAMFLSERGTRIGYSSLAKRLKHVLFMANLHGKGYHLHSLRHTSITHEQYRFTMEFVQHKSGHEWIGTTAEYTHFSQEALYREFFRVTKAELDRAANGGDGK